MLEKINDPKFVHISKPSVHALNLLQRVLVTHDAPVICEIGIGIGATTVELCKAMEGKGEIYLFDFEARLIDIEPDLTALGYTNVRYFSNSKAYFDSYAWSLANLYKERLAHPTFTPLFDFVFLDGAHAFQHDAPATLIAMQLLKPGGYLLMDDYDWSFAKSPTMNPSVYPAITQQYSAEQIQTSHVQLVCDLFLDPDPNFTKIDIGYRSHEHRRAYQKQVQRSL